MNLVSYRVLGLLLLALAAALPARAQGGRKVEVSGGYQLLALTGDDVDETLGTGWYADVAGNLGSLFAVVFQVGGSYKTLEETETIGGVTGAFTAKLKVHNFLGGVRVGPRHAAVSPYAEFLVGGVNGSVDLSGSVVGIGEPLVFSNSDSGTDFAMQVGGGATFWVNRTVGIRGALAYMRIMGEGGANVIRAAGGVTFGF